MFKVHHSYLHKQPQKVKSCCGKSPRVRICSADREQVRVLHRYSYLRYPFFTLMTMTSQFRACLRAYKNANHVYTMYSSLEIPKCKIFGRLQLACVTSLKTKKKQRSLHNRRLCCSPNSSNQEYVNKFPGLVSMTCPFMLLC